MSHAPLPRIIPSPGGEIAIVAPSDEFAYNDWKFAPVRRAGAYINVSGVVVGRAPDGPTPETFQAASRAAIEILRAILQALRADFADVVMINTFHDRSAPEFGSTRQVKFDAFRKIQEEFMTAPHPAWTAVGTGGLIRERGIMEVQMIAYSPQTKLNRYVRRESCILD